MSKYGSIVETLVAPDFWNLALSVSGTPPADITILAASCSERFIGNPITGNTFLAGFQRQDVAFLKSISLYSNLGDGLVPANVISNSIILDLRQVRFFQTSGTIFNTAGSATVTGVGTAFTNDLAPGQKIYWLDSNITVRSGVVGAVASDTSLTLTAPTLSGAGTMFTGNTTGLPCYAQIKETLAGSYCCPLMNQPVSTDVQITSASEIVPISGKVMTTAGSTVLTGIDTKFLSELADGMFIRIRQGGSLRTLKIATITSDTVAVLSVPGTGTAGVPFTTTAPVAAGDSNDGWLDAFVCFKLALSHNLSFYTISIDPAYASSSRRLIIGAQAEVEHDLILDGVNL